MSVVTYWKIVSVFPVIFGPNYTKSNEAKDLIKLGVAKSVKNYSEFQQNKCIERKLAKFKKNLSLNLCKRTKNKLVFFSCVAN